MASWGLYSIIQYCLGRFMWADKAGKHLQPPPGCGFLHPRGHTCTHVTETWRHLLHPTKWVRQHRETQTDANESGRSGWSGRSFPSEIPPCPQQTPFTQTDLCSFHLLQRATAIKCHFLSLQDERKLLWFKLKSFSWNESNYSLQLLQWGDWFAAFLFYIHHCKAEYVLGHKII